MNMGALNALPEDIAVGELLRCCGSSRWAREMAAARPFVSFDAAAAAADRIWDKVTPADWLEAFAAHPRIGEGAGRAGRAGRAGGAGGAGTGGGAGEAGEKARTAEWAHQEQAGARDASEAVRDRLAAANREYESRFGYLFIVCATGKSAEEMLAILERRLVNDPARELRIAAEEQRKITRLRLAKLLEPRGDRVRGR